MTEGQGSPLRRVWRVEEGIDFRDNGGLVKRVLYPQTCGCQNATLAVVYQNPGEEVRVHQHPEEELYYVFRGRGIMTLGDEQILLEPGVAVYIPGDVPHGQRCTGEETLNLVAVIAPPFAKRLGLM
ncbi:MAG: cupin domain-containing protein [Chloroflexi bacterium]|nr:cupin domain-containing protein [Chloroflexota bacterium]MCL5947004.1 cupin domain-containing protein [Chloroflexota bacterium]